MSESKRMDVNEELHPALKSVSYSLRDIKKSKRTLGFRPSWM